MACEPTSSCMPVMYQVTLVPITDVAPVDENISPPPQAPAVPLLVEPTSKPKLTHNPMPFVEPTQVPDVSPVIVISCLSKVSAEFIV